VVPFLLLLLAGLTWLAEAVIVTAPDPRSLFERFFPPHASGAGDPFATAEAILERIARFGQRVTLVAVPAFLWFSTRAFASVRTALNDIYDVSLRPGRHRHFLLGLVFGKLRDLSMVVMTLLLFVTSNAITTALALLQVRGEAWTPRFAFWVTSFGHLLGQVVAYLFIVVLFFFLYRFASTRKIRWKAALVASLFAGTMFEIARRVFAFYVVNVASWNRASADAQLGAIILAVLWVYYSALVFLLGGVVAETWELRRLQHMQRASLTV
jgi:membrane protein